MSVQSVMPISHQYHIDYDNERDKLIVKDNQEEIGEVIADDFIVSRGNIAHITEINEDTQQKVRCLKIKEKNYFFAKKHPITNGVLSAVSCLSIAVLALPWLVGYPICFALGGFIANRDSYGNPMFFNPTFGRLAASAYHDMATRGYYRMQPVFIKSSLKKEIDKEKSELVDIIQKIDQTCSQNFFKVECDDYFEATREQPRSLHRHQLEERINQSYNLVQHLFHHEIDVAIPNQGVISRF